MKGLAPDYLINLLPICPNGQSLRFFYDLWIFPTICFHYHYLLLRLCLVKFKACDTVFDMIFCVTININAVKLGLHKYFSFDTHVVNMKLVQNMLLQFYWYDYAPPPSLPHCLLLQGHLSKTSMVLCLCEACLLCLANL